MKTQSNPEIHRTPWNYGWTRLHVGYYAAVFVVLSIMLGFAHPIESLPGNLLIAALWPISTPLAAIGGIVYGQFAAIAIPIACYAPYFLVKDICALRNRLESRGENPAKKP